VAEYPDVRKESIVQPPGAVIDVAVFQSPTESRVIKVSHQNFLVAFTRYIRFEEFKAEVLARTAQFCSAFGIEAFSRVGLRYVNEISLPSPDPGALTTYLRPLVKFDRFPADVLEQFAAEFRARYRGHLVTLRSALLPGMLKTYVLDIDCHTDVTTSTVEYPALLDKFHDSSQRLFLDHITEDYKEILRGKK